MINKLQIGDIGFSFNKKNLFSKLIYAVSFWRTTKQSNKKVSHSFIYMGDNLIAEASFAGVAIVNIKKYQDKKHDLYWKRYSNYMNEKEKQTLWMHAANQAGLIKYSFLQLPIIFISKLFNIKFKDYTKYDKVCSEFVSEAYRAIGVRLTDNEEPSNDTPLDLFESNKLKDI